MFWSITDSLLLLAAKRVSAQLQSVNVDVVIRTAVACFGIAQVVQFLVRLVEIVTLIQFSGTGCVSQSCIHCFRNRGWSIESRFEVCLIDDNQHPR